MNVKNPNDNIGELNLTQIDEKLEAKLLHVGSEKNGIELKAKYRELDVVGVTIARKSLMLHFRTSAQEGIEPDEKTIRSILTAAANGKTIIAEPATTQPVSVANAKAIKPNIPVAEPNPNPCNTKPTNVKPTVVGTSKATPKTGGNNDDGYTQSQREIQEMFGLCNDADVLEAERLRRKLRELLRKPKVARASELRKKYPADYNHSMEKKLGRG